MVAPPRWLISPKTVALVSTSPRIVPLMMRATVKKWIAREYFQPPPPAQHPLHHQVEEREALHLLAEHRHRHRHRRRRRRHRHRRPVEILHRQVVLLPLPVEIAAAAVAHHRADHLPLLLVLVDRRMPEWMQVLVSNNAKQRNVNAIPVAKRTMIPLLPLAKVVRRNVSVPIINVSKSVLRPVAICEMAEEDIMPPKKKPQKKNKKKKTPKPRNPYVLPARKRKAGPHKNKATKRASENKHKDYTKEDV
jgi:hypothetical protein